MHYPWRRGASVMGFSEFAWLVAPTILKKMTDSVGRNELCPCGSGLKYKKCCGSVLRKENREAAASLPPNQLNAQIPPMGLPGQRQQVHIINRFKGNDPRNSAPFGGSPGDYVVTFVLGRPGFPLQPEGHLSFAHALSGDSHLAITKPAYTPPDPGATEIRIYATTEDGQFMFTGHPNPKGFLGKLVSAPFKAQSRDDAENKAFRAVSPALSNWSAHLDLPLEIVQRDTKELSTENVQASLTTAYLETPFAVAPTQQPSNEFRGYISLYREGLGSSSTVYRFLCFYKIIEGLRARRKRLERSARKSGAAHTVPKETLPKAPADIVTWLNALFPIRPAWDAMCLEAAVPPESRGQEMQGFVTKTLKPIRDNISHALTEPSGELTVSSDELLDIHAVDRWLPLTKCIVRRMLKTDFAAEFLPYLGEDGIVHPVK